jgi:hypothetical protein
MFEASIGGKKESCDFAIGACGCQPNYWRGISIVFETAFTLSLRNAKSICSESARVELSGNQFSEK